MIAVVAFVVPFVLAVFAMQMERFEDYATGRGPKKNAARGPLSS